MYIPRYLKNNPPAETNRNTVPSPGTSQNMPPVNNIPNSQAASKMAQNTENLIPEVSKLFQDTTILNHYPILNSRPESQNEEKKSENSSINNQRHISHNIPQNHHLEIAPNSIQEYCHSFDTDKCFRGESCSYIHNERPVGACLRINCNLCNMDDLLQYCSGKHYPRGCTKIHSKWADINLELDRVIKALEENNRTMISHKYKLRELITEKSGETKETIIEKINQLSDHRNLFMKKINNEFKQASNTYSEYNYSRHIHDINVETKLFSKNLPAYSSNAEIIQELSKFDKKFCLILGETGSGKTTQVPQFLYHKIKFFDGKIICVQPRKVSAISLAKRVAHELDVVLGEEVGYLVGPGKQNQNFAESQWGSRTKILFVTESILLRKLMIECKLPLGESIRFFQNAQAILLDEIHERSLLSDLIFGITKTSLLTRYPYLKIFLASATIDEEKMSRYFNDCRVIRIPGKSFPVQIKYKSLFEDNYTEGTVEVIKEVFQQRNQGNANYQGHILAFLTTVDEMEDVCYLVDQAFQNTDDADSYVVHFLHGRLSNEEQQHVFETSGNKTKIILATKLAESSITINGVKVVIDCGYDKDAFYNSEQGITVLDIDHISKASAKQRAGRAGRTSPGICYRLYSEDTFQKFDTNKKPEIAKVNLDIALLKILNFGLDPKTFPYLEPPEAKTIQSTLSALKFLGAVDEQNKVTLEGKIMIEMSTEPRKTKAIIQGSQRECAEEVMTILAMEAYERSLFYTVKDFEERKKFFKERIGHDGPERSDHLDYLYIFQKWKGLDNFQDRRSWCQKYKVKNITLERVARTLDDIKREYLDIQEMNPAVEELMKPQLTQNSNTLSENILKSLMSTCLLNIAKYSGVKNLGYINVLDGFSFHLHAASRQKGYFPHFSTVNDEIMIYSQMDNIKGHNLAKTISFIDIKWLDDLSIVPGHLRAQLMDALHKDYNYFTTNYQLSPWALRKFKGLFKDRINEWAKNLTQSTGGCFVGWNCVSESIISFIHAKKLKNEVEDFYKILKADLDKDIAKESLLYSSENTNYTSLIKDGLQVQDILLPHEYITVYYTNIPANFTKAEIIRDLNLKEEKISYLTITNQSGYIDGYIRFSNKRDAKKYLYENEEDVWLNHGFEIHPVLANNMNKKQLLKTCQIKLTFCVAPSLNTAKITFQNSHDYQEVLERLSENPIIDGERTRINIDRKKPYAFYIKNLNPLTDEYLLKNYVIGDLSMPKVVVHREVVEEAKEKYTESKRHIFVDLFNKYLNKEELDNMYVRLANSNRNFHIKHAFVNLPSREVAEKIVNDFNGKVGVLGTQRLRVKILSNTTIKVPNQVFTVLNWLIHKKALEISETHPGIKITVDKQQQAQNFSKIRVRSENHKLNRTVTSQFEKLVKGEEFYGITAEDSMKLTDSSMKDFYVKLQKRIDWEYQEYGKVIYIALDCKMKKLTLYSPLPEVIEKARKEIQKALDKEVKLECIDLRNYNIKSVRELILKEKNDFPTLATTTGREESTRIDLDYLNKKAYIRADKEAIENFKEKIKRFLVQYNSLNRGSECCPICFEELDDDCYFLYNCGHKLCKSDFIQCVESQHGKSFVTCPYPDCSKIISLRDIKEALPIDRINNVIERHVKSFVQVHNEVYRNCPTSDCDYIYLKESEFYKCDGCMESYCVKNPDDIHEYHEHENCEALRMRDGAQKEFEMLVEKGDVKITKCCRIPMTRSEGCSHMVCTQCGKHFCWLCLQVCLSAEETYLHIEACPAARKALNQVDVVGLQENEEEEEDVLHLSDSDSDLDLDS